MPGAAALCPAPGMFPVRGIAPAGWLGVNLVAAPGLYFPKIWSKHWISRGLRDIL